jgi:NhaA family Na+:H+ antiporter
VEFSAVGAITLIVFLSLLLGKAAGVAGFAWLGSALGFALPAGVGPAELIVTGVISGIGLTVALFVAGEAFTDRTAQDAAKMGALASILIAPLALILARALKIRRIEQVQN